VIIGDELGKGCIMRISTVFLLILGLAVSAVPVPGSDFQDELKVLTEIIDEGKYEEAAEMADRLLAQATEEFGPDSLEVANILNLKIRARASAGKFDTELQALAEQALRIRREKLGENHRLTGSSINTLGNIQQMRGNLTGAMETYTAALKIQQAQSEEDWNLVVTYGNLGNMQMALENYPEASQNLEKALEITERIYGPDDKRLHALATNLGVLYKVMGNREKALHYYQRALEIVEKNYGPNHPAAVEILGNIASEYSYAGRYEDALTFNKRAQVLAESTLGPQHPDTIFLRQKQANYLWLLGDEDAAADLRKKNLADCEQVLEPDHPFLIEARSQVAMDLGEEGKFREAEAMYRSALDLSRRIYGEENGKTLAILLSFIGMHEMEGKYFTAIEEAVKAGRIQLRAFRRISGSLNEATALRRDQLRTPLLEKGANSLLKLNEQLVYGKLDRDKARAVATVTGKYWDQLIRSRAAILDEIGARGRVLQSAKDQETKNLIKDLEEAQDRLAGLLNQDKGKPGDQPHLEEVAKTIETMENAEKALAVKSLEMRRRMTARSAGLDDVRSALPFGTALIAFSTYEAYELSPPEDNSPRLEKKHFFALVLESGARDPWAIRIGEEVELEPLIERWQKEAGTPPPILPILARKAEQQYREAGLALREMLWDPIAERLGKEIDRVLIVPTDQINLVSFATMPDDKGGYLAESGISLHYLSAERDLAGFQTSQKLGGGLLALGGIRYQQDEDNTAPIPAKGCETLADLRFTPLPGSRLEATEIASLWTGTNGKNPEPVVLTGSEATESAFEKHAPGKEVIHLATHGFFAATSCENQGDRISGITGTDADLSILVNADLEANPLLLTGLAMSGANDRLSGSSDDGLLSATEIALMPLQGVRWAVLSACETGLGRIQEAEGVLGMRRAFQIAGVSTLIMSLWPVDDRSTQYWMNTRIPGGRSSQSAITADGPGTGTPAAGR
jgi:CHAT domain-containing protein